MLRRQVGRYTERDKISAELSELENAFYGSKVREILNELARFDLGIVFHRDAITEKKGELSAMEKELKAVESSEPEAKRK
jgi:chromosome segregation ATPase